TIGQKRQFRTSSGAFPDAAWRAGAVDDLISLRPKRPGATGSPANQRASWPGPTSSQPISGQGSRAGLGAPVSGPLPVLSIARSDFDFNDISSPSSAHPARLARLPPLLLVCGWLVRCCRPVRPVDDEVGCAVVRNQKVKRGLFAEGLVGVQPKYEPHCVHSIRRPLLNRQQTPPVPVLLLLAFDSPSCFASSSPCLLPMDSRVAR
ncbi:hypothetical protein FQN53_008239, partial [Emmonsiellopsis sp. PD_33]